MKTIIIDSNHLLNRNFHIKSFQNLSVTIDGETLLTGAVFGFLWSIKKIVNEKDPDDEVFAVWDSEGKNWRHELDSNYKANRGSKTNDFYFQAKLSYDFLKVLGIPQYKCKGYEADDIIGTLAKKKRIEGKKVLIISKDKDFNQLISRHVNVLHPGMGGTNNDEKLMTPQVVLEEYGIPPTMFIDYLALIGDSSDNVAGIDGVGPKTAKELLLGNNSIEEIVNNDVHYCLKEDGTKKVASKKLQEKINASKKILTLAKQLVTIKCDLEIDDVLDVQKPDFIKFKEMLKTYQLNSCLRRFDEFVSDFS